MSEIDDLNNKPSKGATDIYYPDAGGGPAVPGENDLPQSGRKTLGDWLNQATQQNITPPPNTQSEATINVEPINRGGFTSTSDINPTSDTNSAERQAYIREEIGKGAGKVLQEIGGASLDGAPEPIEAPNFDPAADKATRISAALSNNRFSPGGESPYLRDNGSRSNPNYSATQMIDRSGPKPASTMGVYDPNIDGLKMKELQNVAEQLLLNAVGDKKTEFGDSSGAITEFGGGVLGAQLGRGRAQDSGILDADVDFRPVNAINPALGNGRKNTGGFSDSFVEEDINENKGYKRKSYGVLNNHLEKFAGALPTSMIALAAVAALASIVAAIVLALLIDVLGFALTLGGSLAPEPAYQGGDPSKMPKGAAFGNNDYGRANFFSRLYAFFGLPTLEAEYNNIFPFTTAASVGAIEFFIGNALSAVGTPQIATISAGYYVVVVRNALRDLDQITEAAQEIGDGGGLIGAIEGFFSLIDAFRSSATFRFLITLITIGDRIAAGPGLLGQRDSDGRIVPKNPPVNPSISQLHTVIRTAGGSARLSYSFSSLPQLYLQPRESFDNKLISYNDDIISDPDLGDNGLSGYETKYTDTLIGKSRTAGDKEFLNRLSYFSEGRIPTGIRESIERELNTYYVPFYFHDLRTNEILPMPAFVSNISDSFSPQISEVKGFGRMDPVQIYGSTTRKIGFSFYMVATNADDYSALYYGINKLVSLVYPQWGGGRFITNANGETFQVPYSYVQTASPLIRLRLGELFASNRTPETVRRLFGTNTPAFEVEGITPPESSEAKKAEFYGDLQERSKNKAAALSPDSYYFILATNLINPSGVLSGLLAINLATDGVTTTEGEAVVFPHDTPVKLKPGKYAGAEWTGLKWKRRRSASLTINEGEEATGIVSNYILWNSRRKQKIGAEDKSDDETKFLKNDVYYLITPSGTGAYSELYDKLKKKDCQGIMVKIDDVILEERGDNGNPMESFLNTSTTPIPPIGSPPEVVTDSGFLSVDNNVIVKSMKESGGAGIAGFITNLDFDWNEAPWETSAELGRAPKYVKVTMGFSPIHDEPLGLNPDGSLRSAAYPVGDVVKKTFGERFRVTSEDAVIQNDRKALLTAAKKIIDERTSDADSDGVPNAESEV